MTLSFERHCAAYEEHAQMQARIALELASKIPPGLRRGFAVELGAGTGLLARALSPWRGEYWAGDISPRMCAEGRARTPCARWLVMDARRFCLPRGADWFLSSSMLQWIGADKAFFGHLRSRRAPNGKMAVSFFVEGSFAELFSLLPEASPFAWASAPAWRAAWQAAGWQTEIFEEKACIQYWDTPLAFLRAMRHFGGGGAPRVETARLLRALKAYPKSPQGYPVTWRYVCAVCA